MNSSDTDVHKNNLVHILRDPDCCWFSAIKLSAETNQLVGNHFDYVGRSINSDKFPWINVVITVAYTSRRQSKILRKTRSRQP